MSTCRICKTSKKYPVIVDGVHEMCLQKEIKKMKWLIANICYICNKANLNHALYKRTGRHYHCLNMEEKMYFSLY